MIISMILPLLHQSSDCKPETVGQCEVILKDDKTLKAFSDF
jgi:hypothetical protein